MTRNAQETSRRATAAGPDPAAPPPNPERRSAGPQSRIESTPAMQRGALLRRLLAAADWTALIASLCVATAASNTTDIATLFWAVLFSPAWIIVVKLHGLYDNDHRRIRHSSLDELPSLVSATVIGILAIDGLLSISPAGPLSPNSAIFVGVGTLIGTFLLRASVRVLWNLFTEAEVGLVIGRPGGADLRFRRIATHPEPRLRLAGYLGPVTSKED